MTDIGPSEREIAKQAKKVTSSIFRFLQSSSTSGVPNTTTTTVKSSESKKALSDKLPQDQLKEKVKNLAVSTPPNAEPLTARELHRSTSDTGTDPLQTIDTHFRHVLYKTDNERWSHFWKVIEDATQTKREHIAYVLVGIISAILIWSSLGDFVCTLVGIAYPSIATYKMLNPSARNPPVSNAIRDHWFKYWSIYAFVSCFDVIIGKAFKSFPPYQMGKVLLFLAASLPDWNLSGLIYGYIVGPAAKGLSKIVDKYIIAK